MKRGAFTLIEILVAVVIIVLLVALLYPVLLSARRTSQMAPCISNLKQVYQAWSMYVQDSDGKWPGTLADLALGQPSLKQGVLQCPLDDLQGANREETRALGIPVSYFYIWNLDEFRRDLRERDSNHGILVCVLHGERGRSYAKDPLYGTYGKLLRLRVDGSVKTAQVGYLCRESGPSRIIERPMWILMTDVLPCPDRWCVGNIPC